MYGKRRYQRINKSVEPPVDSSSIPTYICGRCKVLRNINTPFSEFSLLENSKLICYTKLCGCCSELLKTWIKG
jgi:hypothetical protein